MARREWPAVVTAGDAAPAVLSRAVRRGTLVRLARGVYSGRTTQAPEVTVRAHWIGIVGRMLPGAVVVGRSAELLGEQVALGRPIATLPDVVEVLEICHARRTTLTLPGLLVRSRPGVRPYRTRDLDAQVAIEIGDDPQLWRSATPATTGQSGPLAPAPVEDRSAGRDISSHRGPVRTVAPPPHAMELPASAQMVGLELVRHGPATRPQLGAHLGLSKPTVSAAVTDLEGAGLVAARDARLGTSGRSATVYALAPSAGWTLGVDVGNAQIRLASQALDGRALEERHVTVQDAGSVQGLLSAAATSIAEMRAALGHAGPLRATAVALSKPVRADHRLSGREGPSLGGLSAEEVLARLLLPPSVPTLVENNVNCAVLAEVDRGAAAGRRNAVFLQVGERVGAGIVLNGQLVHGAHGGAGEVADLPFPWNPGREPSELGVERHLGAAALVARAAPLSRPAGADLGTRVSTLLGRAESGERVAMTAVRAHSREISRLVSALVAVLDPEVVILGGTIGDHPLVARWVRGDVAATSGHTEVLPAALGGRATVEGATTLAANSVLDAMFPRATGALPRRETT